MFWSTGRIHFEHAIMGVLIVLLMAVSTPQQTQAQTRGLLTINTKDATGANRSIALYSGYHALVVGCAKYRNGWSQLPNPVKDAREVAETLRVLGWGVNLLEDPDWATLRRELNRLITGPGKDPDKAILFWFSGHGHTLEEAGGRKLGYLIPIDAPDPEKDEIRFMELAISMRQIETVAKRILSKHVLMVFDSCFSGAIFSSVRSKPSHYIREKVASPSRQFITAGTEDEEVPDQSVFKTVFIQGVKDRYADRNRDGYVAGLELGDYLQEQVVNYSKNAQHPQFGQINDPLLDKGDFVFMPAGGGAPRRPQPTLTTSAASQPLPARTHTKVAKVAPENRVQFDPQTGMTFVWLPGGCYAMGSPDTEKDRDPDEGPVHQVCLDPFWIGKTEVTQGQWEAVIDENPARFKDCGPECPVERVSWEDALDFIAELNDRSEGAVYRLPTEAEWEYACRAGSTSRFSFGDQAGRLGKYAWHWDNAGSKTHPVGSKTANAWGLHDMHGNVWEWCQDVYRQNAYAQHHTHNPLHMGDGFQRVVRGGGWGNFPKFFRCANRSAKPADKTAGSIGLRLVMTP